MKSEFNNLSEALELGFNAWKHGAIEANITPRIAEYSDGSQETVYTLWTDEPLTPISPNWENSVESWLATPNQWEKTYAALGGYFRG